MEKGTIVITLEGMTFQETERCRQIIHVLFEKGVFNIRNGKAILNFDDMGLLAEIESQIKLWKRGKETIETNYTVETQKQSELNAFFTSKEMWGDDKEGHIFQTIISMVIYL